MGISAFQRRFLLFAFAGLAITGLGWAWSDLVHGFGPVDDQAVQSTRAWLGRVHGAFALPGLISFGALLATHVPYSWRAGSRSVSGIALVAIIAVLAASAYGLYYASGDLVRAASTWTHMAAGVAVTAVFALHWLVRGLAAPARDC